MRTIFAEYNPKRNSIDVYTSVGYMLRIDCSPTAKDCIKCRPKCVPRSPAASRVHANSISAVSSPARSRKRTQAASRLSFRDLRYSLSQPLRLIYHTALPYRHD